MRAALIISVAVLLWQILLCQQTHDQRQESLSDGTSGSWSSWGECSRSCGGGVQNRTRVCPPRYRSPPPLHPDVKVGTAAPPRPENTRNVQRHRINTGTHGWRKVNSSRIGPGFYGYGRISYATPLQRDSSRTSRHRQRRSTSPVPNQRLRSAPVPRANEPLTNALCLGAQHRVCNRGACPSSSRPIREQHCSAFDTQPFMGRLYQWEPFSDVSSGHECELNCRAVGFRFYVRQADRLIDGTPCGSNRTSVCVAGRCQSVGCDDLLGSGKLPDRCGVCGGDNSACKLVSGLFQHSLSKVGYHKIVEIPPGATKINVTEMQKSRNYLALLSRSGRSIINGNWAIDRPGMYEGVGTMFTYRRPNEISSTAGESFLAEGPTNEILDVYMIYQQPNPGIHYEFIMPSENAVEHKPADGQSGSDPNGRLTLDGREGSGVRMIPEGREGSEVRFPPPIPDNQLPPPARFREYNWKQSGSTDCSASCGRGSRFAVFVCVHRVSHAHAPNALCDSSTKPSLQEEPCNVQPCPAFWDIGEWSECSKTCGLGMQHRQVLCRQSYANRTLNVHSGRCHHLERPETSSACQMKICSEWHIRSDWSPCSVPCGVGQRSREVHCVSNVGDVVSDEECNMKLRPSDVENCDAGACSRSWFFSHWSSQCSADCGAGVRSRSVVCLSSQLSGLPLDGCGSDRPADVQSCNNGPCESRMEWFTGPWTQCSSECGSGSQQRAVVCLLRSDEGFSVMPPYECSSLEKPLRQQSCFIKSCGAKWHYTDWSACSKTCEAGYRVREVRCLSDDMTISDRCDQSLKPHDKEACQPEPCLPLIDEKCRDKYFNCNVVVQARLCVYDYYQTACCASCTRVSQRSSGRWRLRS